MGKLFDKYDLRARLSPSIILISPIILNMYLLIDSVREVSTTIVVAMASFAIINLFTMVSRCNADGKVNKILEGKGILAQELLSPLNNVINKEIKQRYYNFLNRNINELDLNFELSDETIIISKCDIAIKWLKSRARNEEKFPLVKEELINTGFCKNMYGNKAYGIIINIALIIAISFNYYFSFGITLINLPSEAMLCILIDFTYLLIWIFLINEKLISTIYKKYSIALINTCDIN